ncbi:MAG: ATP-binding protein, partial [Balneola sp.]
NKITFTFSDNGIGFDSEANADRIFELNQKFHDHADSKGVGLYLVHNHVTNSGGKISVNSAINKGTTFTITFKK